MAAILVSAWPRDPHVSTAITSMVLLSDWGSYLGDATLTAAILDRLAMHAIPAEPDPGPQDMEGGGPTAKPRKRIDRMVRPGPAGRRGMEDAMSP